MRRGWLVATIAPLVMLAGLSTPSVFAWDCSLPVNYGVADCPVPPPPPPPKHQPDKHAKHPEDRRANHPTPPEVVVNVAAPARQVEPAPPAAPGSELSAPRLGEYCHLEPSTQQWEIRRSTDVARMLGLPGNEQVMEAHLCNQHPQLPPALPVVPAMAPALEAGAPISAAPPAPSPLEAAPLPIDMEEAPPPAAEVEENTEISVCLTDEFGNEWLSDLEGHILYDDYGQGMPCGYLPSGPPTNVK